MPVRVRLGVQQQNGETMNDHSRVRQAKIALASALLSCSNEYLESKEGAHNLELMGVIMRDRDVQKVLTDAIDRDTTKLSK